MTVTAPARETAAPREPRDLRKITKLVKRPLPRSRSGHLAYVGADGNVYVVDPLTGATVQVTRDRSSEGTGYGIFHTGMAWSRTGELAFARTNVDSFTSALYVTVPGTGETFRVTRTRGMLIYASWSPAPCADFTCSRLATITDVDRQPGGNVALTVLAFPNRSSARAILEQTAAQIYFSWAGERDGLIRHVTGDRILRGESRLDEVDLTTQRTKPLTRRLAPFLAPAFIRGRVVYAVGDSRNDESSVTVSRSAVIIHTPPDIRRVVFAPSPDGRRLAFAVRLKSELRPAEAFEEPSIVDLETGEVTTVGPPTLWTEAFYWSPDSRKLAYLSFLDNEYRPYNQWRIFDVKARKERGSAFFQPTDTFNTLTTFFDQFGQSHSFWSPDSRYLTYAAVSDNGQPQVWLLDTKTRPTKPVLVADGVVSAFSFR